MDACARNMQSDSAEIKPAQCCIKLVFHLTQRYSLINAHQRQFTYIELGNSKQLILMSNYSKHEKPPNKQGLLQITYIELYVKTLYIFLSTTVIKTGNNYTCASLLHFWINIHFLEASRFSVTYYTYRDFFFSLNEEFGILAVTIMVPTFNTLLLPSLKYKVNTRLSLIRSPNPLPSYPAAKLIKSRTVRYGW